MPDVFNLVALHNDGPNQDRLDAELRRSGFHPSWHSLPSPVSLGSMIGSVPAVLFIEQSHACPTVAPLLKELQAKAPFVPIIYIIRESDPPETAAALAVGVTNVVSEARLDLVGWVVRRVLEESALRDRLERAEAALQASEARHAMELAQQRQMVAALRQSEGQYRNIVEGAMEGLVIHQNGIIRFANGAAARLAGYEQPSDLVGRNIWETFVAPEARAELQARGAASLNGQRQAMHPGWPGIRKDGRQVWVQSSVAQISWQGQPALLGYFFDISERKRTEESLRASEERFSKAFHGSPLPVSIVTLHQGRYIDANSSLTEMLGLTRDEIIGRSAYELGIWMEPSHRQNLVRLVEEHSLAKNFPTRLRVKGGEVREVLISAERILLGEEQCMIVVTQDITDQRHLEEQLRQAQKMEAVGQLAGGIAHDFNNLLTVIQGHAALLKDQEDRTDFVREAAEQITFAAERAASLTRQLLTFSRRQVMQLRTVDLNSVIEATGKLLRRVMGENIQLHLECSATVPVVRADPGMLEQVLLNLAVNSKDAMPQGGQLTIATSGLLVGETTPIDGWADAPIGPVACISVTDTGCGIPPEILGHIFEPFFTTKGIGKGTGLGLASVYGIVKQHKGGIQVASEVGRGTTFHIFLPTGPSESPMHSPNAPKSRLAVQRRFD